MQCATIPYALQSHALPVWSSYGHGRFSPAPGILQSITEPDSQRDNFTTVYGKEIIASELTVRNFVLILALAYGGAHMEYGKPLFFANISDSAYRYLEETNLLLMQGLVKSICNYWDQGG